MKKKILIEIDSQLITKLKKEAKKRGMFLSPFVQYILNLFIEGTQNNG